MRARDPRTAEALFRAVMEEEPRLAYRALLALSKRELPLLAPFVAPLLGLFQTPGDARHPRASVRDAAQKLLARLG